MQNPLAKLNRAKQWLAESRDLPELRQIHDIAIAADAYAKAHRLGLEAENHAMEIRLLAARRIGELVPPEPGKRTDIQHVRNSDKLVIPKQRLSEFRKLAAIPDDQFKKRIEETKNRNERLNYNKMLSGATSLVAHFSRNAENYTPKEIIEKVRIVLGEIDLDPASCDLAQTVVNAKRYYTEETDGLKQPWRGRVFLNPPYSMPAIRDFTDKLIQELSNIHSAIVLTNDQTDTLWWHKCAKAASLLCMPQGRLHFWTTNGTRSSPTNGQTFFYYGKNTQKFQRVFGELGLVLIIL